MNAYENFHQIVLKETVSPPTTVIEAVKNEKTPTNSGSLVGMGFLFFLALVITLIKWCDIGKSPEEGFFKIRFNHKTPCSKCRYFNNNSYLKCAVQPEKVMTKEAKDCQDYCP
ncbi:hypothetical protein [Calothrix sp. CCY 0018]|uniref:hypothetical protein n=1 Tax=Calothrix sp. CCY 0018 TaxID=3103864 RepID=UPI0039C6AE0E